MSELPDRLCGVGCVLSLEDGRLRRPEDLVENHPSPRNELSRVCRGDGVGHEDGGRQRLEGIRRHR